MEKNLNSDEALNLNSLTIIYNSIEVKGLNYKFSSSEDKSLF